MAFQPCTLAPGADGDAGAFFAKVTGYGYNDMISLPTLTKESILENLKRRFKVNRITSCHLLVRLPCVSVAVRSGVHLRRRHRCVRESIQEHGLRRQGVLCFHTCVQRWQDIVPRSHRPFEQSTKAVPVHICRRISMHWWTRRIIRWFGILFRSLFSFRGRAELERQRQ
eukprot:5010798-Prymnesium_polylepis.2